LQAFHQRLSADVAKKTQLTEQVPVISMLDEDPAPEDDGCGLSCSSSISELTFLRSELRAAKQTCGWSDVSRKVNECNVITLRKFCARNQHHFSLLRALRAAQVTFSAIHETLLMCKPNVLIAWRRMS
jgi:hypothetical protein